MAAVKYSFVIEQGATTEFEVAWQDANSNPIDLSTYHARMQIRSGYGGTLYATLSSSKWPDGTGLNLSGSNNTSSPKSGSIGVYISAATSSNFTFSDAVYDLEMVSGSHVTRLLEGKIKLSKEVTI
jgi:hypothetical protein